MNNRIIWVFLFTCLTGAWAWAASPRVMDSAAAMKALNVGGMSGGGDKGVVCRNPNGTITHAETLDLFEAHTIYGLQLKEWGPSFDDALAFWKRKIGDLYSQSELILLLRQLQRVQENIHWVDKSVTLKPVDDSAELVTPSGCAVEQLANYVDDHLLLVDQEIWDALDIKNRIALYLHEAIYRLERDFGAKDSRRSRKIVGYMISDFAFIAPKSETAANAVDCEATQDGHVTFQFTYSYQNAPMGQTILQFSRFDGQPVYSRKTAKLPFSLPWAADNATYGCAKLADGCRTGTYTDSNFEGSDDLAVRAIQSSDKSGKIHTKFYFETVSGRHELQCSPADPAAPDRLEVSTSLKDVIVLDAKANSCRSYWDSKTNSQHLPDLPGPIAMLGQLQLKWGGSHDLIISGIEAKITGSNLKQNSDLVPVQGNELSYLIMGTFGKKAVVAPTVETFGGEVLQPECPLNWGQIPIDDKTMPASGTLTLKLRGTTTDSHHVEIPVSAETQMPFQFSGNSL